MADWQEIPQLFIRRRFDMGLICESRHFFSEGVRLAADLYLPSDAPPPEGRPGVVMCHGYNGMKHLYLPDAAKCLVNAGYAVLCFDYKGWGESDGPVRRLDPHGRVADVQAALTILCAEPNINQSHIGLFGWSFGCSTAIWTASIDQRVKVVVGVVGVGDGERWLESVWPADKWQQLMQDSRDDRLQRARTGKSSFVDRGRILFLDAASQAKSQAARKAGGVNRDEIPLEFVDETIIFKAEWVVAKVSPRPLLLISCSNDQVAPPYEMQALYDAALEPKKLIILEGKDHYDVYSGPAFDSIMAETLVWLSSTFKLT